MTLLVHAVSLYFSLDAECSLDHAYMLLLSSTSYRIYRGKFVSELISFSASAQQQPALL